MKARIIVTLLIVLFAAGLAAGQKRAKLVSVTGTVTDTVMAPVSGALIVVDGQGTGVLTRRDGTFRIKIRSNTRSVGAYTSNLGSVLTMYEGQSVIDFVLDGKEAMKNFMPEMSEGERKIDVGYGTVRKDAMTTGVGFIDGQGPANASYTNIYDMIRGQVPGVQVMGNSITIRGVGSFNSSTEPLFVVDDVIVSSIDNISPRDVKSITILKGSDASIYGSRGANGVIVITMMGYKK